MTSPWAKIEPVEPTNLQDIMSEQVAIDLQIKEDKKYANTSKKYRNIVEDLSENATADIPKDEVGESDVVIAMMLQKQFDKEYDEILKKSEHNFNGSSEVSTSNSNYRRTSPWAKIQPVESTNLQDIMAEQVPIDLPVKEDKNYVDSLKEYQNIVEELSENATADTPNDEICKSDAVIAMMMQKQFDKEYDEMLKKSEDKFNGSSKVSISYSNYRRSDNFGVDSDSEDDELVDIIERKDWDRFDSVNRSISLIPRCGYRKQEDGHMVTKHDMTLAARKNTCKLMSFPPEFQTGDGAGFDLQLSNKVFNSLKAHSKKETLRRHRIHDKREDHATAELGIDEFTRLILYKLVNNQLLEKVNGVISTGKEAVILHADSDPSYTERVLPKECVIKVFKTTLSEYKQRDKYIKDDHRFKDRYGNKQNSRKMVHLWAEKEMANLVRLQKIGVPSPEVIALKKHILVMSFIGIEHRPAPKLKDAILKYEDWILAYEQVVEAMKKLYSEAKLIHADLSEYNILWHDEKCWFIDVSQSVEPTHPNGFNFLFRDCTNIATFFAKRGVPEVKEPTDLFTEITGYDFHDKHSLPTYTDKKPKPHLIDRPEMKKSSQFDYEWDNSKLANVATNNIVSETDNLQLVDTPVA